MYLNATLFVQMVLFFVFAFVSLKFIWPGMMDALDKRAKRIAEGLAAADKARAGITAADQKVKEEMAATREFGIATINAAEKQAQAIINEAKEVAAKQAEEIINAAKAETAGEMARAREELRPYVASLAVKGAEQILKRPVSPTMHADILNPLQAEL